MSPGAAPPPALLLWGAQVGRGARRALLRGALGLSLALLLLWAALFLYGSFYWAYLPSAAVLRPLHLAFRSDCDPPGPELCSFPSANVSLLGEHREKVLLYGQQYRLSLELELPESPVNRELGMFMVALTVYGDGGRALARAERAAMLHYRSRLLRALHTVTFAGLLLSGFAEQSQSLELELLGRYREDPYTPTLGAFVEIRSRRVQLYGARLRVDAHFSGLRLVAHEDDPDSDPELDLPSDLGALTSILGGARAPPEEDETQKLLTEAGQERERRRRGQELSKLREWRRDEERRRAAEERRRDRAEERAARQRVKEKIERDKAERAQRFAPVAPEPSPVPPQEPPAPREYDQCRIQVRLPDGRSLTQSFQPREPLAAVRLFVELHWGQTGETGGSGSPPEPFSLRTAFPRRLFTEEDMEKPLQELGLVPSAVVIVAKKEGS
ncbi:hypothetical protein HGM15179_017183 [Zosterops borbonicus]|uniref:Seipin n=1 Tax=Zosterops borbonicus TaxID=364589 RepID=A0A8K1G1K5_9PASS|nr:hypothetical protein HGM15179_017183 [Zosterops borbonicus]